MGLILWIIFGAIIGSLGFRVAGESNNQGCLTNIVIGIGGAMLGGSLLTFITGDDLLFSSDPVKLLLSGVASVLGASALVLGLRALGRRS